MGSEGLVIAMEIDPLTFEFATGNLRNAGYTDIILIREDGGLGYPRFAPYDRICLTAACPEIPPPLVDQLRTGGRLIAPVMERKTQNLVLLKKTEEGFRREIICEVLYVSLGGRYGKDEEAF